MTLKLLFTRRKTLPSLLIRVATWSEWSHVDMLDPDDNSYLFGATGKKGVHRARLTTRLNEATKAAIVHVPLSESRIALVREYILDHLGASYDWPGLIHFIFPPVSQDPDRMFCSELIGSAILMASPCFGGLEHYSPSEITPEILWNACLFELLNNNMEYLI